MLVGRVEEKQQIFPVTFFFSLFLLCEDSQERVFRAVLILYVSHPLRKVCKVSASQA